MSLIYTFFVGTDDEAAIPEDDVKNYPKWKERISYDSQRVTADKFDIELSNIDRSLYDDRVSGSLFYGKDFYKQIVTVYDSDLGSYIWKGFITNLIVNRKVVKVRTKNYLASLSTTECIYDNSSSAEAPAEAIYNILKDVVEIPEADIIEGGFQAAISIQDAAGLAVKVDYSATNKKKCIQVINELCRLSQCHLFSRENSKIYLYQWQPWDGMLGYAIKAKDIEVLSYSHEYEDEIFNSFVIAYGTTSISYADIDDAGSAVQSLSDDSMVKYSERVFNVPDSGVDDSDVDNVRILITTSTGAIWAGEQAVERFHEMRKTCSLTCGNELDYVKINDQIDLDFDDMAREPARIIERVPDKEKKKIKIKAEFLNIPYEHYSRDLTAPAAVWLDSASPVINKSGAVRLCFSQSFESDHLGYKIYFTTTKGRWNTNQCSSGQSPVDVKNPATAGGFSYCYLYQLEPGVEYYFKIVSYDTSLNESADSNIVSTKLPLYEGADIMYMVQQNAYGISLDVSNSQGGAAPSDYTVYTDFSSGEFGSVITAFYESPWIINRKGFEEILIKCQGGNIQYQYKIDESGSWSSLQPADKLLEITMAGSKRLRVRFVFYGSSWSNDDSIIIKELKEVA